MFAILLKRKRLKFVVNLYADRNGRLGPLGPIAEVLSRSELGDVKILNILGLVNLQQF